MHPLEAFRRNQNLTADQLGKLIGVTGSQVLRWEDRSRRITERWLPVVSRVTGIPKAELRPDLVELMRETAAP